MAWSPLVQRPEWDYPRVADPPPRAAPAASDPVRQILAVQRSAGNAAAVHALKAGLIARAPAAAPTVGASTSSGAQQTHVVASGETLQTIAKRFGVTVQALSEANADKIKKWSTPKGDRFGFNAGEIIVIPVTAPAQSPTADGPATTPVPAPTTEGVGVLDRLGDAVEWASDVWNSFFGDTGTPVPVPTPVPAPPETSPPPGAPTGAQPGQPAASTPIEVIAARNADGTFSQAVSVNSTKRDGAKQLKILRDYCTANKAALDDYVEKTDWLKDALDWTAFEGASLGDESVWLPFFFALYYGGGGPGVKSDDRTLPLVASPVQTTWTDKKGGTKTANASPHIAGKAMDVDAADLDVLDSELKTKVPEFSATGAFPIKSTQLENVSGQSAVHINFKNVVF